MENIQHPKQATLDYLTRQIDIWNKTAVRKKQTTITWRKRMFILILMGTFFGLASQTVVSFESVNQFFILELHEIFAICSAMAIALSSYAGTQILTSDLEKSQIKARSTAEALKVQAFLYLMGAAPYQNARADKLIYKRIELILKEVKDIIPHISDGKGSKSFKEKLFQLLTLGIYRGKIKDEWVQTFDANMTFDQYFEERVKGQINGYYLKKAAQFQKVVNRGSSISVILGFVGVVMGTTAATVQPEVSMWIAFLSTGSASIASYLHSNKYEYLMISYISTANQLELISAKHQGLGERSIDSQRKLVAETETIFAMEHNAWISEIAGTKDDEYIDEEEVIEQPVHLIEEEAVQGEAVQHVDDEAEVPIFAPVEFAPQ